MKAIYLCIIFIIGHIQKEGTVLKLKSYFLIFFLNLLDFEKQSETTILFFCEKFQKKILSFKNLKKRQINNLF